MAWAGRNLNKVINSCEKTKMYGEAEVRWELNNQKHKIFLFEEEIWRLLAFSSSHDLPDHIESGVYDKCDQSPGCSQLW